MRLITSLATESRRIHFALQPLQPSKLADKTSKKCPKCGLARKRRYEKSIPLARSECDKRLQEHKPRVSLKDAWWNRGPIRYLIQPTQDSAWFQCWEVATCPECGPVRVWENEYIRQFGRIRLAIFWLKEKLSIRDMIDRIIPNH